ncbi:cytochrome P450 [Gulosibacter sp. 10]|uniref:cytochrome P450 n=1 Tax=Gulosibacter sp. 10 TaxID=1255570 RepID=UPI00097F3151|nr:cytochrome P450 [Gulosibacter sp. 10]SJM63369.1 putative cytochrome P450 hydroxylase [Gulosibacter sp. 10]
MTPTLISADIPVADWFDPHEAMVDPYPQFARLRALGPIVHAPAVGRVFLTTHEAVSGAERRPEIFSSYSEQNLTMMRALGGRPMLRKDDPEHAAERSAINPTLRPKAITSVWSPRFAENVAVWAEHLLEIGPERADLNRDFAAPVASQNLIDLLGFPEEVDVESMRRWSTSYIAGIGNLLDDAAIWRRCDESQSEVDALLDELLPRLREAPDGSVTSHLLQVGLPEEVVRANVHLTISGGMNEPQHMITNMVWALSLHPEQRDAVLAGEVSWGDAFEETARWQSPIGMIPREVAVDSEFLGAQLPEGTNVGLLLASANRDEQVFPDADRYDARRTARGHLAFGSGVHMCAGRWAAKNAIAEHALPALYERIPSLRLDPERPTLWDGWVFRGITALPVTW